MKKYLFFLLILSLLGFPAIIFSENISLSEFKKFTGNSVSTYAGRSVASAGDVNGDGYDDVLIGASGDGGTSSVYLIYGQNTAINSASLSTAVEFTAEASADGTGSSVSSAGDVNGDGYNDFVIGAPGENSYAGAAYLIYGQSANLTSASLSQAVKFTGEAAGNYAGYSVSSAGDVDNDGYDDILIGANQNGATGNGAAYLIYGQASNLTSKSLSDPSIIKFTGEEANDYAGTSVSSAGDVNGDGYSDILIGANNNDSGKGAIYVIYGQASNLTSKSLSDASIIKFTGEEANDYAGTSVSSAGDVDNDGYDDFLAWSSGNGIVGAVYLVYGQAANLTSASLSTAVKFISEVNNNYTGTLIFSAGDVNNDGYDDILIGNAAYNGDDTGIIYLIYGQAAHLASVSLSNSTIQKFNGEAPGDTAGFSVSSAGDVNNDGYDDILIGASGESSNVGAAYLGYLYIDNDHDGVPGADGLFDGTDCNDSDNTVSSNQTYYQDSDGDGLGDPNAPASFCSSTPPTGYAANSNDTNDEIKNEGVEIDEDEIDNDNDTEIDEPNTVEENGPHPEFGTYDPFDPDLYAYAVVSVRGFKKGKIRVTFIDNSVYDYIIFSHNTTKKLTKVKQYQKKGYFLVLQALGKKLALVNIFNGDVLDRKILSKKVKYQQNSLKLFTLRSKKWATITAKNKQGKVKLSLVKVLIKKEKLSKKVYTTLESKKIKPSKTKRNKNTILLRSKNNKIIAKYLLTKKMFLKSLQ